MESKKLKYATLLLVAILILNVPTFSDQATGIMSLQFQREVTDKDSAETLKGTVYYQPLHKAFIEILEPISQLMVIDGKVMTIYYPVEKKAFRFHGQGPIPMPFIQNILSVMQDDYGLTEMGYSLTKHKTKADTLYTYWDPPKKLKKKLGQFVLGTSKNRLVYAEHKACGTEREIHSAGGSVRNIQRCNCHQRACCLQ